MEHSKSTNGGVSLKWIAAIYCGLLTH